MADDSVDVAMQARCRMMVRAVERLLRTTEQVISLAGAAGGSERQWMVTADALSAIAADMNVLGVRTTLEVEAGARQQKVRVAPGAFEALMQSLLSNAAEHGDPTEPIAITIAAGDGQALITIDNRIGRQRHHQGLGIGLYLTQRLAADLGAQFSYAESGERWTARVALPATISPLFSEQVTEAAEIAQMAGVTT